MAGAAAVAGAAAPALEHARAAERPHGRCHVLFHVVGAEAWGGARALAAELTRAGQQVTIWWQAEDGVPRAMAGAGEAYPATVFEQVHPAMGDRVRAHAVAALGSVAGGAVWDLYAGIGETTAALAAAGARVESVESDRRAVARSRSARPGGPTPCRAGRGLVDTLGPADLVVTNPPRTGMDARVCAALERRRPERVVYISCDPATLARDLSRLPAYRLTDVAAFDLFPQTAHVETVVVLEPTA